MVSWKADGVRYLVLIKDKNEVYAFDRDNNVFQINGVSFVQPVSEKPIRNCLVDAEMIIDRVVTKEGTFDQPRLLIYDLIHYGVSDQVVEMCFLFV